MTSNDTKAELVELLYASANRLRDNDAATDNAELALKVAYQLSQRLQELASKICDHCRVDKGRCRYCGAIVIEGAV